MYRIVCESYENYKNDFFYPIILMPIDIKLLNPP